MLPGKRSSVIGYKNNKDSTTLSTTCSAIQYERVVHKPIIIICVSTSFRQNFSRLSICFWYIYQKAYLNLHDLLKETSTMFLT